jgi:hypothetical protein
MGYEGFLYRLVGAGQEISRLSQKSLQFNTWLDNG